jgi:ABC-type Fe3+/spermidine/putrescine transport system ATPase subunit
MIRPENTALCDPGAGHVGGQVADVTYLGSASRVVVATPLGRIVSRAAAAGAPAAGSTVGLTWAADQMVVLDDEQPPGSPPAAATMEDR